MIAISIGIVSVIVGIALLVNFARIAERIFDFYASFMRTGSATPGTIRLVGGVAILVGAFWIVTAVVPSR
ncbi:hypothetical protein ABZ611_26075 [Streptomyces sp. NPDC007861]|uniref:hypothetical protein n=1 Tax=Streptomyces sp. NPDC007861 TaxID=3154893 RepID=UPI0034057157